MPLLFSHVAIHDALQRVKEGLFPGELLLAFLDDVYVVCSPNRVRAVFDMLARELSEHVGIQLNEGKTRVWNRAGVRPPHMEDLGPEGVKILGTPIGSDRFIEAVTEERLTEERRLWDALAWVLDRARGRYCFSVQGHDTTISFALYLQISLPDTQLGTIWACSEQWRVSWGVFQALRDRRSVRMSSRHCQCDLVVWVCGQQGGWHPPLSGLLGRTHPMLSARLPELTNRVVEDLSNHPQGCLAQLEDATRVLDRSGFVGRPEWHVLRAGRRPPEPISSEPGEWKHGWQYHGSSSLECHFRETVVLTQSCPAEQAHLRSHSGPGSSAVPPGPPTGPEYRLEPQLSSELQSWRESDCPSTSQRSRCECGDALDTFGRHRARGT